MFVQPGAGNVQVIGPNAGATIALQTGFAKNTRRFSHLNAIQRVPTAKTLGVYAEYDADDIARITADMENPNWRDGDLRPAPNQIGHQILPFATERDSQTSQLGNLTIDQDQIGVVPAQVSANAHRMMLKKARSFEKLVTDPAVLTNTGTMTAIAGGKVGSATSSNLRIKTLFDHAVAQVQLETNGAVGQSDIVANFSATTARKMAATSEIREYMVRLADSRDALQQTGAYSLYGLPSSLYGVRINVINESIVTSAKGAASKVRRELFTGLGTVSAVTVGSPIVFLTRHEGRLQANDTPLNANDLNEFNTPVNAMSTATVVEIYKEDMTVEQELDGWNRIQKMGITSDWTHVISSTRSAFLVTDAV